MHLAFLLSFHWYCDREEGGQVAQLVLCSGGEYSEFLRVSGSRQRGDEKGDVNHALRGCAPGANLFGSVPDSQDLPFLSQGLAKAPSRCFTGDQ
jgi:hypothetical protein